MNTFNFKKHIKRRWRRWKRTLWMTAALIAVAILAYSGLPISSAIERLLTTNFSEAVSAMGPPTMEPRSEEEIQTLVEQLGPDPDHLTSVVLETQYICGVETEQLGKLAVPQLKILLIQHPEWEAEVKSSEVMHIKQHVDDLSPLCKEQAYISIDAVGNLNLYEGRPAEEKVIRTFFQMDVGSLETSLPEGVLEQLQQGIRIQDKDEYDSVISTFSDYAVDEAGKEVRNGG
ncbi:BofC C-terminal domain-containing protein [Paenibacillus sp. JNUCC31]|uniref:BofC C-terminal domain-containing protein n=1 Tax=Paenibacillus sp. JNUCC-31 TaxID=2777983 RepID=UPI00177C15E5|nr:BofC C-terminal domain-containing protein [Paenibacillus sp. JNUCC-31]QOS80782.1 BofC C-terminal domain-containing protein [Paenibacillus sp. JNUCC-31]